MELGTWKTFKYAEPFSRHNLAKHWVDDVSNGCHDPIGLEIWAKNCGQTNSLHSSCRLGCQLLSNTVISLGVSETVITPCYCDYCDYCYFFK